MNPVENELMEEIEIELSNGYKEITRKNGTRGIIGPDGFVATMFTGPDPMINDYRNDGGKFHTFELKASQ
jgi:hypothetical protein